MRALALTPVLGLDLTLALALALSLALAVTLPGEHSGQARQRPASRGVQGAAAHDPNASLTLTLSLTLAPALTLTRCSR